MALLQDLQNTLNRSRQTFSKLAGSVIKGVTSQTRILENLSVGAQKSVTDYTGGILNTASKIGATIPHFRYGKFQKYEAPQVNLSPFVGKAYLGENKAAQTVGKAATDVGISFAETVPVAKIFKAAPLVGAAQRALGSKAAQVIAGSTLKSNATRFLTGKAIANVSQGIPYTLAYRAMQTAKTGKLPTGEELAGDLAFDAAVAAVPFMGATTGPQSQIVAKSQDILKSARSEIVQKGQEAASRTFKEKLSSFKDSLITNWDNAWYPVEKYAAQIEKQSGLEIPTGSNPKYLIKRLFGAGGSAEYNIEKNFKPILRQVQDIPREDFEVYLKAQRDLALDSAGRKVLGSDPDLARTRMTALFDVYGEDKVNRMKDVARKLYDYEDTLLQKLKTSGFLDDVGYEIIKKRNENYVPFKRLMEKVDEYVGMGAKGQVGTQPIKSLEGSERQVLSPLEEIIANTYKFETLAAKNNVAKSIVDLKDILDDGAIKPLRTSENVKRRIDIFTEVGEVGKDTRYLERLVSTRNKWVRQIQGELNRLNRTGMEAYLKRGPKAELPEVSAYLKTRTKYTPAQVNADSESFAIGIPSKVSISMANNELSIRDTKKLINDLVNEPPEVIAAIRNRMRTKNRSLLPIMEELDALSKNAEFLKNKKASLLDEASLIKDAASRGKATMSVWRDGVKELYEVPADIEAAVKGMNEEATNAFIKVLAAPASFFRQAQTGRNIDFMVPNFVKDQFDAAIASEYGYKPFIDAVRGMAHLAKYDATGSDELVETWLRNGGSMSFGKASGREVLEEEIINATTKKGILKKLKDWAIEGIDVFGRYSEASTRVGLFKNAMEKTGDVNKAIMESREATIDFSRMGAKMKIANSLIPFLNPQVQGASKLIRLAAKNPGALAVRLALYGTTPAALLSLYNNAFYGDDYRKVSNSEKYTNFIIMTGSDINGRPAYIKIPKGNIVPLIANPTDSFITYLYDNSKDDFDKLFTKLLSDALPVVAEGSTPGEVVTRTLGANFPQAVKPLYETASNYDYWAGRNIVPYFTGLKEPGQQSFESTPDIYKTVGEKLNVSPLKLQHLVEGYLGGAATVPTNIGITLQNIVSGEPIDPNQIPILRRFIGNWQEYVPAPKVKGPVKPKVKVAPKPKPRPSAL